MKLDIQKSTLINAPIEQVRQLVSDFSQWNSWSPWIVLEPTCSVSVTGTPNSSGHTMSWEGDIIGSGQNVLTAADGTLFEYDLAFFKPWKSKAKVSFLIEESADKTKVTWAMNSSLPFFLFFMLKSMKNWIGMDYERGLKMLKAQAETGQINATTTNAGIDEYKGFSYIGIQRTVAVTDMADAMAQDFKKIVDDIVIKANKGAQHWVCIYQKFDMKKMQATYIAAVSDEDISLAELDDNYVKGEISNSKALEIKHHGAYDFLGNGWSMGMMYMQAKKLKGGNPPFEQYWNSPLEEKPEDLKTSIYFPLK